MTNRELIALLSELPLDYEVIYEDDQTSFSADPVYADITAVESTDDEFILLTGELR